MRKCSTACSIAVFYEPHGLVVWNTTLGAAPLNFGGVLEVAQQVGDFFVLSDGQYDGHAIAVFIGDELRGKRGWFHGSSSVDKGSVT